MRFIVRFAVLVILVSLFLGCSEGSGITTVPNTNINAAGISSDENHHCLGLYQMVANPDALTLDVVTLRQAGLHLNALPFLEPPPFTLLTLEKVKFIDYHHLNAHIGLRHPYLGLTQFTGFDVCGVVITSGTSIFGETGLIFADGPSDSNLLNADGYTRWWNPSEFPSDGTIFSYNDGLLGSPDSIVHYNSQLNGYKYYTDELEPTDDVLKCTPSKRGVFSPYSKNVREFQMYLDGENLVFNYAIDACWKHPTGSSPWTAPDDFPPGANREEAWAISITELENTLFNDNWWPGGELHLAIDVYDHFNAGLNTLTVQSPGNFDTVIVSSPSGGGEGFSTYMVDITETSPAPNEIPLYITVQSEVDGYGGKLPGEPVYAYFKSRAEVAPEPGGCFLHVDDDNISGPWDGSAEFPYKLLQDAIDNAIDDCIINVHPGHYNEIGRIFVKDLNDIVIRGKSLPTIQPAPPTELNENHGGIHIAGVDGLTIDGLGILASHNPDYFYKSAILISGSKNVTINNCTVLPVELPGFGGCIWAQGSQKLKFIGNTFDKFFSASYATSFFQLSGCSNVEVTLNSCLELDCYPINEMTCGLTFMWIIGCGNVTVSKNRFGVINKSDPYFMTARISCFQILIASNLEFRNNLFYQLHISNPKPIGSAYYDGLDAQGVDGLKLYNNTWADIGTSVGENGGSSQGIYWAGNSGLVMHSNILVNMQAAGSCRGVWVVHYDGPITQDYSCVWNMTAAFDPENAYRYYFPEQEGPGGIDADPMFADPLNGDYTLLPGSPCIGTGLNGVDMGCYGGDDPLPLF